MQKRRLIVIGVFAFMGVLALPTHVWAKKQFLQKVAQHYGLDDTRAKCTICHNVTGKEKPGKKNLNAFGQDYKAAKESSSSADPIVDAAIAIENKDSDGDGATNIEELMLGTAPGDPKSTPDAAKLKAYRDKHPTKK